MDIIVTYQHRDMQREAERECATYDEAQRLANGCIEDGGTAHVDVYLEGLESGVFGGRPWDLFDLYLHYPE